MRINDDWPVAYPELVSGGVSKNHTFKGLVKVGASKGVISVDFKKNGLGGGVPGNQKIPLDTPLLADVSPHESFQSLQRIATFITVSRSYSNTCRFCNDSLCNSLSPKNVSR